MKNEPWRFNKGSRLLHLEGKLHQKEAEITWLLAQNKRLKDVIRRKAVDSLITVLLLAGIAAWLYFGVH